MLGAMWISSWRRIPSRSGQNGITCMRPTAPVGETAQRSKRLSTSMSAITRPGGNRATRGARSAPEALPQERERLSRGKLAAVAVAALAILEPARLEPAIRHHHAVRDAEQLGIGELDSGARIAVVVQHFDPGGSELGIQAGTDLADTRVFLQVKRHQHHLEGRDRIRPDDAALIVVLLDGRRHDPRHADAVATHVERGLAARL